MHVHAQTQHETYDVVPANIPAFSVSIGIFILSYAGHACLPEIYVSMREPEKFERVLDVCFVIMFVTYSGMALFGYLQYGQATKVLITDNLVEGGPSKTVAKILICFVIASCYFQVSPILSVVAVIPEDLFGIDSAFKKRLFRTSLFAAITVCSWCIVQHLAVLEAVTGSLCTMITSVICPALFYFGLNTKSISRTETVVLGGCVVSGVLLGAFLVYNDVVAVLSG